MKPRGKRITISAVVIGATVLAGFCYSYKESILGAVERKYYLWKYGQENIVEFYNVGDFAYGLIPGFGSFAPKEYSLDEENSIWKVSADDLINKISGALQDHPEDYHCDQIKYQSGKLMVSAKYFCQIKIRRLLSRIRADVFNEYHARENRLIQKLNSNKWHEVLMEVENLGRMRSRKAEPYLKRLLGDQYKRDCYRFNRQGQEGKRCTHSGSRQGRSRLHVQGKHDCYHEGQGP